MTVTGAEASKMRSSLRRCIVTLMCALVLPATQGMTTVSRSAGLFPSANWTGYAAQVEATNVLGWWEIAKVTCDRRETSSASQWVGLGGMGTEPLVQVGIISRCFRGVPVYLAFHQIVPSQKSFQTVLMLVHPGDSIEATIDYQGSGQYALKLTDNACWCGDFTMTETQPDYAGTPHSAEWIVESGQTDSGQAALSNFGTFHFESLFANNAPVASDQPTQVVAVGPSGGSPAASLTPISQYGGHGPNFDITWVHA